MVKGEFTTKRGMNCGNYFPNISNEKKSHFKGVQALTEYQLEEWIAAQILIT